MSESAVRRSPFARPTISPAVKAVLLVAGLFYGVFGLWAFFAPASFAAFVAFPFELHLLHVIDSHLGGHGTDAPALALLVVIGVAAMIARARSA